MKKHWRIWLCVMTLFCAVLSIYVEPGSFIGQQQESVFTKRTLVKGSRGTDVRELQGRLKLLGYYKGRVDGVFGWGTYWSVRNFQYKFGIRVDGKVGSTTRTRLVRATRNYNPYKQTPARTTTAKKTTGSTYKASYAGRNLTANDLKIMSNAVYGEARGEPYIGQVAIAAVILNRLENAKFPSSVPGVIFQPGAFTAVADGQIWLTPNATARRAVNEAIKGWDPSTGAIYYFNPATATSKWIWSRPQIKKIGRHIFCR